MKITGLVGAVATGCVLALPAVADDEQVFDTRFGRVEVVADPTHDFEFLLRVDGAVLHRFKDMTRVEPAIFDENGRVFLLVEAASGGIACPFRYVIVELAKARQPRVSTEFGTCAEVDRAVARDGRFVARMPAYLPHPELIEAKVRRRLERSTYVYSWAGGSLRESVTLAK